MRKILSLQRFCTHIPLFEKALALSESQHYDTAIEYFEQGIHISL